jgi:hypothetical protein
MNDASTTSRKDYLSGYAYGTSGAHNNGLAALAHAQRHIGIEHTDAFIDGYWDSIEGRTKNSSEGADRWTESLRDSRGT